MSSLRHIMEKLKAAHEKRKESTVDAFSELLKCHVDEYQAQLETCSPAMLNYEWTWLKEHIEALELCIAQPAMCEEIGGRLHAGVMLEESRQYQAALEEMFHKRMLHPSAHSRTVNLGEHAWEVSHPGMKEMWGLE
jgi:hypothetical protein